jgi:hypothetical protein
MPNARRENSKPRLASRTGPMMNEDDQYAACGTTCALLHKTITRYVFLLAHADEDASTFGQTITPYITIKIIPEHHTLYYRMLMYLHRCALMIKKMSGQGCMLYIEYS